MGKYVKTREKCMICGYIEEYYQSRMSFMDVHVFDKHKDDILVQKILSNNEENEKLLKELIKEV